MAKKLKAELDLDTTKARSKAKEIVDTGGGAASEGGVAPSADRAANSLEKAARGAKNLGESADKASSEMGKMGKLFAGMGIGLAQSLAAHQNAAGGWLGSAATGAVSAGMMGYSAAGKKGGAAAALASFGVSYFENEQKEMEEQIAKSKQTVANVESIRTWEEARKRTLEFRETLESLTNVEDSLADRQHRLAEEIRRREEADKELARQLIQASGEGGSEFQKLQSRRSTNAAEIDALNALMKQLGKESGGSSGKSLTTAPDALSRVGGDFANSPGGSEMRSLLETSNEQLRVLRRIEAKKERDTEWQ